MNKLCLAKNILWACKMTKKGIWGIINNINKGIIGKATKSSQNTTPSSVSIS